MRLLIVGASGHGRVVANAITTRDDHTLVGFVDSQPPEFPGHLSHPFLGSDADLRKIVVQQLVEGIVVAIGDNWTRARVVERLERELPDIASPPIIHASAVVARDAAIAGGSVVMAGAIVNPGVVVNRHAIINTGACIDHDCIVGAFASLAPRVACGGGVTIGDFAAIGIGATIIHGLTIGQHVTLGAGAVAVHEIPEFSVALGVPARVTRKRSAGERYL